MKRKWHVNDDFFDNIDSEEKAYLLGFFIADGNLRLGNRCTKSYRLSVALQNTDVEILDLYSKHVTIAPITTRSYQTKGVIYRKPICEINWTSSYMGEVLINKYKIIPRKTYDHDFTFDFNLIKQEYWFDFIRGYFDGDGAISYNENTHALQFAIYGTSVNFLNQIANIFEHSFDVERVISYRDNKNVRLYCLMFNAFLKKKEFHNSLFEKFYNNKTCYLERKMLKMRHYLEFKYRDNPEDIERLLGYCRA